MNGASQRNIEIQVREASQPAQVNQYLEASQHILENHVLEASQITEVTQCE